VPHGLYRDDPVLAAWREALRADPVAPGGRVLFARWAIARESGEGASPATAAIWLDIKRDYVELRPALRRFYLSARDLPALCPALEPLGFVTVAAAGGRTIAGCDFGAGSTDGWLARLVGDELGRDGGADDAGRELRVHGQRLELTPRESDLLAYLRAHAGNPVAREALARDVWGHAWTGGSANAIEAAVSSLRRKLGDRAGALQTVRGVGYRLDGL
jgi:hypothetical protein